MGKRSPKPSEIIEAVYDFCEDEKDVSKMSIKQVDKALAGYGINGNDVVARIRKSISKAEAKHVLSEAIAERFEQLKRVTTAVTNSMRTVKPEDVRNKLTQLLNVQTKFVFRNFENCPDQDLASMVADLKVLDGEKIPKEFFQSSQIEPKAAAYRLTQEFVISEPKEIDLEAVAMARGALVISGSLRGCDARLIRKGLKGIIRVSDNLTDGQKRFAIAHELGHWEMHQGISQWNLCANEHIVNYNSSPPELQASAFASEFLMPTKLFRPLCEEAEPNLNLIKQLANDFGTGLTAAALRFIELNENPCMVAVSNGKRIRWWRKNDKCGNVWFKSKQEIAESTLAARCIGQKIRDQGESVPYSAWFKHAASDDRDTVFEQSIKLGNYDTVLTLLWFD